MFVRRRPLLRAAVVGGGAYAIGKHKAERDAQQSDAGQGDQQASGGQPAAGTAAEPSVSDQLSQLSRLHEQGALSDSEFAAAKTRLLAG